MKNFSITTDARLLRAITMVVALFLWLGSVYQVEGAPPEPLQTPDSTPPPQTNSGITVENIYGTLPQTVLTNTAIEIEAVVFNQGFEGAWPASNWTLVDQGNNDGGIYRWGKRDCRPHTGSFAGWSVGGGTQGSALACSANYPNFIDTWAVYGPFSLSNANNANLTYHFWGQTEGGSGCPFDVVAVMSSIDGQNFSGQGHCGDFTNGPSGNGYYQATLDLSNRLGQSQVWVAFQFVSDSSITYNGITVDDITLNIGSETILPPSNLTASPLSQTQNFLTWQDNSNNETGFKIEQALSSTGPWTQIATTPANITSHTPTGLTCNTTYYYRARAYSGTTDSTYSNTANATTLSCVPPTPPSNLTALPFSKTQINLAWQDNSNNETGFRIERSPNGTTSWSQIAIVGTNVTTYSNLGVACDTPYFYRVQAYNGSGNSAYSNIAEAATGCVIIDTVPIYLPLILKSPPPPPDGHWTGTTSRSQPMSFDVSGGGRTLQNFKLKTTFSNGSCSGTLEVTVGGAKTISNNQFSHNGGTFSFSGQLISLTTANGSYSFVNHSTGCGLLTQSGTWSAQLP